MAGNGEAILVFFCCAIIIALAQCNKFVSDGSDFVIGEVQEFSALRKKRSEEPAVQHCIKYSKTHEERARYNKTLVQELETNNLFREGWNTSKRLGIPRRQLSEEEALAVTTYTLKHPPVYSVFNRQSREIGPNSANFTFKGMHYFLTAAVNKLSAESLGEDPYKVYRGVTYPVKAKVNDTFNFENFASTSFNETVSLGFLHGNNNEHKTMFVIKGTSKGAKISQFSRYMNEEEVLIPSCENFKVTATKETQDGILYIYLARQDPPAVCFALKTGQNKFIILGVLLLLIFL